MYRECLASPEVRFGICHFSYKISRSPWNRCTLERSSSTRGVHAPIHCCCSISSSRGRTNARPDSRRATSKLSSKRPLPPPPPLASARSPFHLSPSPPSSHHRHSCITSPPRWSIAPPRTTLGRPPNLCPPPVEKSLRGTCHPPRGHPPSSTDEETPRCSS